MCLEWLRKLCSIQFEFPMLTIHKREHRFLVDWDFFFIIQKSNEVIWFYVIFCWNSPILIAHMLIKIELRSNAFERDFIMKWLKQSTFFPQKFLLLLLLSFNWNFIHHRWIKTLTDFATISMSVDFVIRLCDSPCTFV